MRKIPVSYKLPASEITRINDAARQLNCAKNAIIETSVKNFLDDLKTGGWQHPTCCGNNMYKPCANNNNCQIQPQPIPNGFYCALWEEI